MSHLPNKPTLVAAAIYGLCTPLPAARGGKALWVDLSDAQKVPFFKASEFLLGNTFGATLQTVDRAKLAATLEKQEIEGVDANANTVVSVVLSIASALP